MIFKKKAKKIQDDFRDNVDANPNAVYDSDFLEDYLSKGKVNKKALDQTIRDINAAIASSGSDHAEKLKPSAFNDHFDEWEKEVKEAKEKFDDFRLDNINTWKSLEERTADFETVIKGFAYSKQHGGAAAYSGKTKSMLELAITNAKSVSELEKETGLKKPKNMTSKQFKQCASKVMTQMSGLKKDGWNKKAIKKYLTYAQKAMDSVKGQKALKSIDQLNEQCYSVGSKIFTSLLKSAYPDDPAGQRKTIKMMYQILGVKVDKNNFVQLTNLKLNDANASGKYHFSNNVKEAIAFDKAFSKIVQGVYPKGIPTDYKKGSDAYRLAQETHQIRYYLDKQNIDAIRASYPDEPTDLARIQAYQKEHGGLKGEKARLHNKYQGKPENYPQSVKEHGENVKFVTSPEFHSEWIVDHNGNFVSQWNSYEYDQNGLVDSDPNRAYTTEQQRQLVDGNSVNYADNSGEGRYHTKIDSDPVSKYDPDVRDEISNKWVAPSTEDGTHTSKDPDFFDTNKSEKNANNLLNGDK